MLPRGIAAAVRAQAKINLFLRVLERDAASGYHGLETLFARLDLADEVRLRVTEGACSLDVEGAEVGPAESNLAWRAALAFASAARWPRGFAIELRKRVPVGGGLGGGSTDAAAVLRMLNALAPQPLPTNRLLDVAGMLGSDVPFLASAHTLAVGRGRGEQLAAAPVLPPREVLLVLFPFGVSTAEAYGWLAEHRAAAPNGAVDPLPLSHCDWTTLARRAHNDFHDVVPQRVPPIAEALAALSTPVARAALGPDGYRILCGSGATVAAIGGEGVNAQALARLVPGTLDVQCVATRTAVRVEDVQVFE